VTEACCPRLILCTTCRNGRALAEGEKTPGALLHETLNALIAKQGGPSPVDLHEVACLANCDRGCSAVIAMPGKWTYLLGHLHETVAADLLAYAAAYAASPTGTVLPSQRPHSLRHMIIGRVPYLEPVQ
jgi:predicted metal-binding protein